uniref:EF-hand domain-containing protein n=1 Tax=Ganoderma boninense TaxID=34458 RepID=A0A5K1JS37_9APHY|nr:EF-hand domain-containing protein [Ganoderma boninense]
MQLLACLAFIASLRAVAAHGGHDHDGPKEGETAAQYAAKHMATEHHIDTFDVPSFFQLHDLNRDGHWDQEEIEAVYGVHHVYSQKKSKDEVEHKEKAEFVVKTVLKRLDKNGDGVITLDELEAVGLEGLPDFEVMGVEGHHYDVESEFFLHHEEQFHSTPETQTDEAYTHPEDLEHFAHHEKIERIEAEQQHEQQQKSGEEPHLLVQDPHNDQLPRQPPVKKPQRAVPADKQDPAVRFASAKQEAANHGEWGQGESGYKSPQSPGEKMRKNVPYKEKIQYKFRRTWGDF